MGAGPSPSGPVPAGSFAAVLLAVIAVALGAAAGLLAGRRPPAAGDVPAGADVVLLVGGCGTALAGGRLPGRYVPLALTLAGYALLIAFALRQRRHPGMVAGAAGLAANMVVMAADRGMPVSTLAAGTSAGLHHGLSAADHLRGLADVIPIPYLGLTASPGDLVLAFGAAVAVFGWLRPRVPAATDRPSAPDRTGPAGTGRPAVRP